MTQENDITGALDAIFRISWGFLSRTFHFHFPFCTLFGIFDSWRNFHEIICRKNTTSFFCISFLDLFILFPICTKHISVTDPGSLYGLIRYVVCIVVLLIELSHRQDKRIDELNLFIDYYSKYIVSIV